MQYHVLVRSGVGKLESASFQSPEETRLAQQDRVDCDPSLIFRWSFGTVGLCLHLRHFQSCGKSNNVDHSLGGLELEREAVEWEEPLP